MGLKIYKLKDKIEVKIKDISIFISPLSFDQKAEIQSLTVKFQESRDMKDLMSSSKLALKYAIKEIKGIEDYSLEFDKEGYLSDSCIEDLLNCELSTELTSVCFTLLNGINKEEINKIEGVEVIHPLERKRKSK